MQSKTMKYTLWFAAAIVVLLGDFVSYRILIPRMVSSLNDFIVTLGFIWAIFLGIANIGILYYIILRRQDSVNML